MYKNIYEFEDFLKKSKIGVIGVGVSNKPLLNYLNELHCNVNIFNDVLIDKDYPNFNYYMGNNYLDNLSDEDIIFRSPGCLPTKKELVKMQEKGCIITTEIEMLMKLTKAKIIGVTGSDGKTTTTTLINEILKNNGYTTHLGGNIGIPLFTKLKNINDKDIIVLELSSFQLMGMDISPSISVITNISENHLDKHKNMDEYIESKKNIFKYQDNTGVLVTNYDNEITNKFISNKIRYFSSKSILKNGFIVKDKKIYECIDNNLKLVLDTKDILLRGNHNHENICTALLATYDLVKTEDAVEIIKSFKGVEHRLELVRTINNVKWYNDSVSSSPTRTIAGLNSYDESIVLIAGGYDKNLDYNVIAKPILDHVRVLILFGSTKDKIYNAVVKESKVENKDIEICLCNTLEEVIKVAYDKALNEEVVLFSPASASFDMFKNFADRGNQFKDLVNKL